MAIEPTAASYTGGDAFQAEKRTVFSNAWLPLCHAAQIPHPGDFVSHGIGGWPVFAVRGIDGRLRVFRNVCRHLGMQVVEKPSGNAAELRCRYHGWTYDLAGCFVRAPEPVAPADPGACEHNLTALSSTDGSGFVLFTVGGASASAPAPSLELAQADYAGNTTVEIGCNWKTYVEDRLGCTDVRWTWPLLLVEHVDGGIIVEQIVPRTFLRTRVVFHAMGTGDLATSLDARAATAKIGSEALQAQRASGLMPQRIGAVADLWRHLDEALASNTSST